MAAASTVAGSSATGHSSVGHGTPSGCAGYRRRRTSSRARRASRALEPLRRDLERRTVRAVTGSTTARRAAATASDQQIRATTRATAASAPAACATPWRGPRHVRARTACGRHDGSAPGHARRHRVSALSPTSLRLAAAFGTRPALGLGPPVAWGDGQRRPARRLSRSPRHRRRRGLVRRRPRRQHRRPPAAHRPHRRLVLPARRVRARRPHAVAATRSPPPPHR